MAVSGDGEPAAVAPFTHLDTTAVGNLGAFKPASLDGDRPISVIVKLKGEPVGDRQADALKQGRTLTKAERAAIRDQLRTQQGPVADRIAGLGGSVFERYQDAYNGLAVRIPMKNLPALASLPEVAAIQPDRIVTRDNTAGVQYIGGNQAWADLGLTGNGVKIGIIDTGIDYFHANFGGSGNPADFKNNNSTIIEPGTFPTAKVAGGTDFVGDNFDSSSSDPAKTTPHPDPDPLDCNGHGSHVAGTAAGFGVLSNGHTFTGPYDATTYSSNTFRIGPGVAPNATLFAYRVFGCQGSTSDAIIVAALDQALEDGVDVVNMSLGSPFGRNDAADAEASNTVSAAGLMVVSSAGNSGPSGYITGAPAAADRALSVAAIDASSATFPGATIPLSTGQSITAQLSNGPFQDDPGASLPGGSLSVVVLRNADHSVSLGCNASDYTGANAAGKLVVVLRGVCARVHKAIIGQQAGAAAVAMINTATSLPPFEGDITSDPDTGATFHVTIPFFGIRGLLGSTSDGDKLVAADGGTANSFTSTPVPNTGYQRAAPFTSGGARNVDSAVKPEIAAPGVSVKSTAMGTGNEGTRLSGTSMASPMTTGSAALVIEAHPSWTPEAVKAALINTADASSAKILGYNLRIAGTGVVQPRKAVDTVSYATTQGGRDTLDFGNEAITAGPFTKTLSLTLHNTSGSPITYTLSNAANSSLGNSVTFSANPVAVPAGGMASVDVTQNLSAAAVAALPDASTQIFGGLSTARGAIVAAPTTSGAGLYSLRIPYIFIPRGVSNVAAGAESAYTRAGGVSNATVPLSNSGIHRSVADTYAWGIHDANDTTGGEDSFDVRDVGVQVQPKSFLCGTSTTGVCSSPNDQSVVFAINTYGRASNPSVNEFDVVIDTQNNGKPDFFVVGVDFGEVTAGSFDGRFASFIFDGAGNLIDIWVPAAPMNGSTVELPTLASEIGLFPGVNSTKFNYHVNAFSIVPGDGLFDTTASASFRTDLPPVSSGQQFLLNPGDSATLPVSVDRGKNAATPQLGWLVVGLDNDNSTNGGAQANEVPIGTP